MHREAALRTLTNAAWILFYLAAVACNSPDGPSLDSDTDSEVEPDTEVDTDTEGDTDTEADTDGVTSGTMLTTTVSAATTLASPSYQLDITVGTPTPVLRVEDAEHRVLLGVGQAASP